MSEDPETLGYPPTTHPVPPGSPTRCDSDGHVWQSGPVIRTVSEPTDYGRTDTYATHVLLVCACGATKKVSV